MIDEPQAGKEQGAQFYNAPRAPTTEVAQHEQPKKEDAQEHDTSTKPNPARRHSVWRRWKAMTIGNKFIVVATVVIAIANSVYAAVGIWQLRVLSDQLALMRTDQRAWMGIPTLEVVGKVEAGTPLVIRLVFHNSGKTPAAHVAAVAIGDPKPFNAPPDIAYREGEVMRGIGFASPNSGFDSFVSPTQGKALTEAAFNGIASGKYRIYVHGRVDYEDIFRRKHWMTFCYYLAPDGSTFYICTERKYNDMDENY